MKNNKFKFFFIIFFCLTFTSLLFGKIVIVGSFGDVYRIAEPDPIIEIQKAFKKHKKEIIDKFKQIWENREKIIEKRICKLPKVKEKKLVIFNTEYTLPKDVRIYDKNGKAYVYPAGTKFNVLDFFTYIPTYIVFNPADVKEFNWIKQYTEENNNQYIKYILAGTPDNLTIANYINKHAFVFLSKQLKDFFQLQGTVAVIKPDSKKKKIKIFYYPVN